MRILRIEDHGMWRGKHSWTIVMEDENGRAQVSGHGETEAEAIADATKTFTNRRIFSDTERQALQRSSRALRRGLL